jgi:hypothetical protein
MTKISFITLFFFTMQSVFAQIPSSDQFKPGESSQPTTQSVQLPALGVGAFTSSAEFYRNLQGQGALIQPPPYDMQVDTNSYVLGPAMY